MMKDETIEASAQVTVQIRKKRGAACGGESEFVLPLGAIGDVITKHVLVPFDSQKGTITTQIKEKIVAVRKVDAKVKIVAPTHPSGKLKTGAVDVGFTDVLKDACYRLGNIQFLDQRIVDSFKSDDGLWFVSLVAK